MAVSKQQSFDTYIGTAAEMAAFTNALIGDTFIPTDGADAGKEHIYTGTAWLKKA